MAIEVSVRKEIKSYEEKLIGGMSLRQAACATVAVAFSAGVGAINHFFIHWAIDDIGVVIMFLSIPILAVGWFKKEGMPFEKYMLIMWRYKGLANAYPFKNRILEVEVVEAEDKKERKKRTEYGN